MIFIKTNYIHYNDRNKNNVFIKKTKVKLEKAIKLLKLLKLSKSMTILQPVKINL